MGSSTDLKWIIWNVCAGFICKSRGCWSISPILVASICFISCVLQAQENLAEMEERVVSMIKKSDQEIKLFHRQTDSLQSLLSASPNRDTRVHYNKTEDQLKHSLKIRNVLKEILGEIRQLNNRDEKTALRDLKRLSGYLKILRKNKLPAFEEQKVIPAKEYVSAKTNTYSQPIYHFCNLTQSKDGYTLANEFETLFEFTEPKLDAYYKDAEFLECKARFIKTLKDYFLELKFIFNSPHAEKMIGSIDVASPSRIDFLNGSFIYLQAIAVTDEVKTSGSSQTIYHVQYKLDSEDIKNLSKYELDTITFVWTSGADKYEIVDLDVLLNMFACLKTKS